jgi:hypothetical protein
MAKSKRKRAPKAVLKLLDLEQSKSAVLNSLTSASSKRSYDQATREFVFAMQLTITSPWSRMRPRERRCAGILFTGRLPGTDCPPPVSIYFRIADIRPLRGR